MEGLKNIGVLLFGNSEAGVNDFEEPVVVRFEFEMKINLSRIGEFNCVAEQINQDLTEFAFVAANMAGPNTVPALTKSNAFLCTERLKGRLETLSPGGKVEIHRVKLHAARFNFREVQDLID